MTLSARWAAKCRGLCEADAGNAAAAAASAGKMGMKKHSISLAWAVRKFSLPTAVIRKAG